MYEIAIRNTTCNTIHTLAIAYNKDFFLALDIRGSSTHVIIFLERPG